MRRVNFRVGEAVAVGGLAAAALAGAAIPGIALNLVFDSDLIDILPLYLSPLGWEAGGGCALGTVYAALYVVEKIGGCVSRLRRKSRSREEDRFIFEKTMRYH